MIKRIIGVEEYDNLELLAEGGMGSVYKATKKGAEGFEKIVAIKTLLPQLSNDQKFVADFIAEAKCVANLIHENIVQIYQLNSNDDGYYFVMEYVDGINLHEFMNFHQSFNVKLPVNLAVFIAARVARGLAYAHSRISGDGSPAGIVHCDVCPHNVMINSEGVPKLTDFGIARLSSRKNEERLTGKLAYMSPEQSRKEELDFTSDIYSLGIVLFYLLSGEMARNCSGSLKDILAEASANRLDWSLLSPDTPEEVTLILHKMLASDPAERYRDTAILARDLEYFIYKDGYGPTVVTLANYLRELLPARFIKSHKASEESLDKTMVMTQEI